MGRVRGQRSEVGSDFWKRLNLSDKRRHLDQSQRAMVAAKLANLQHGGDRSKVYFRRDRGDAIKEIIANALDGRAKPQRIETLGLLCTE
jgi:hypothetical protein